MSSHVHGARRQVHRALSSMARLTGIRGLFPINHTVSDWSGVTTRPAGVDAAEMFCIFLVAVNTGDCINVVDLLSKVILARMRRRLACDRRGREWRLVWTALCESEFSSNYRPSRCEQQSATHAAVPRCSF